MNTATDQLINHISLVLDASGSMQAHATNVVKVAKSEIDNLAKRSEDLKQDTRISIYSFDDEVKCLVYDKDVLRLPSIDGLYKIVGGMTALIDATMQSISELEEIPQRYGDHSFFQIVVTDGQENRSRKSNQYDLSRKLARLGNNWTVATLVPDRSGIDYAVRCGFSRQNCGTWETSSATGFEKVGSTIRSATTTYMENRAKGIRGSSNIFALDSSNVNKNTVVSSLEKLDPTTYQVFPVYSKARADEFSNAALGYFKLGSVFYQLSKPEEIQPQKNICVYDRSNGTVYGGTKARQLLSLPNYTVKVEPDHNPVYDIFVQSAAPNRNLIGGTRVLIMK